jgi:hypothetical protein
MLMIVVVIVMRMPVRGGRFGHERGGGGGGILQKSSTPYRTLVVVRHTLTAPATPAYLFHKIRYLYTRWHGAATLFRERNRCQDDTAQGVVEHGSTGVLSDCGSGRRAGGGRAPNRRARRGRLRAGDRERWVGFMRRLADPVLTNLADGTLKARMPVEQAAGTDRRSVTHLEALGRLLAGIAPWIELAPDDTLEGRSRAVYGDLARRAIARAVDPSSPDFMNFTRERQPLVDAAFLAQGLLRAPRALARSAGPDDETAVGGRARIDESDCARLQQLAAVLGDVEAGLRSLGASWDRLRVDYALRQHEQWYKGDGAYGDGPDFHWDYYNSFVIHPMLTDVLAACKDESPAWQEIGTRASSRAAATPPCRSGSSHPTAASRPSADRSPIAAVRSTCWPGRATTHAAGRRVAGAGPRRADRGDSPFARSAGHLRRERLAADRLLRPPARHRRNLHLDGQLVSLFGGLLPLGLSATDEFWSAPPQPWTAVKAWSGQPFPIDHAL